MSNGNHVDPVVLNPFVLDSYVSWAKPMGKWGPYNIQRYETSCFMLSVNVDIFTALWFLEYYSNRYACAGFRIVNLSKRT